METSYFANRPINPVSIARFTPKPFRGAVYISLAPPVDLINVYKSKRIDEEKYRLWYAEKVLYKLDPIKVYKDLIDTFGENCTLCCYEKPSEFCHRHLVARWLSVANEISIQEYIREK